MEKILCTIDQTEVSRKAEVFAAQLAKDSNAKLHYVHVSTVTADDLKTPGNYDTVILDEVVACNHQILKSATNTAKDNGIADVTFVTLNGRDVARAVVDYAETNGCDHIVTGSNGRVGIPRLVMGSISGDIIHKAHCPVTVIR